MLSGIKPGAVGDRGEYCVNQVDQALGFATGRFFVNETFAGDSQDKATGVIKSQQKQSNTLVCVGINLFPVCRYHSNLQEVASEHRLDGRGVGGRRSGKGA